jgi:glyoxylase-like metal-dependent hydrolase (beta-lactamase superfamily II)
MKRALITLCLSIPAPLHAASTNHAYVPTASIDYSPLHHVMIRNDDGTLTPMDQPYFRSTLIAPHTWQIESDGDYAYLVEGEKEALAIDTTYGAGNIRRYMQSLTTKPLRMVANTHFHFDHTALNAYFDKALMSAATAEKATTPFPSFTGIYFPRDYPVQILKAGDVIHLGGRDIEVIMGGNHTPGSTLFLDRQQRVLFAGDEFMAGGVRVNVPITQFAAIMRRIAAHSGEFDRIAGGPGLFDASQPARLLALAEAVLAGKAGETPPAPPAFAPPSASTNGAITYQRRMVRAPDRPAGLGMAPSPGLRSMSDGTLRITYDSARLR